MKWFIPTWNGDLRLVPDKDNPAHTRLTIEKPTPDEKRILDVLGEECRKRGLVDAWEPEPKGGLFSQTKTIIIRAPLAEIGPVVAKLVRPAPNTLTAITFKDGQCVTCSGTLLELSEMVQAAVEGADAAAGATGATGGSVGGSEPVAAATVKRPTPSCPQCEPGAILPASEVLLTFLTKEEHQTWADERFLVVTGGLSGHRYMLAHRHSDRAQRAGRICYDLDGEQVVHFHDRSVPPEEEVLAAKLILEYREPWLRNEATMLGVVSADMVFKNPFGSGMDGVEDAVFTSRIGNELSSLDHWLERALGDGRRL